jgi:hypothetical protein
MKGLELSRRFYEEYGKAVLEKEFPHLLSFIAVGLLGEGSECFSFDDEVSCDHDFEPSFCIFVKKDDYEEYGFELERAYSRLPKEFLGYKRQTVSPVGGSRRGVIVTDDLLFKFLGSPTLPKNPMQWFFIPSHSLACLTNGEIFFDGLGEITQIRSELLLGYPDDVRKKKLAACAAMMAQSGLYNYERCLLHNEVGASQLAVFEFVRHAISAIYLLNNEYEPFYKWVYRKMRALPILSELEGSLIALTELGNSELEAKAKIESIKEICELFIEEFIKQGLTRSASFDMEKQAYAIQNEIKNPEIRNMHVMDGI